MNFADSVRYLQGLGNEVLAMKLGLGSVSILAGELGNPQDHLPAVHLAGTNGKGSTAAMIASIGRAAGLKIGLYTSPHLVNIRERIRVGPGDISADDFARLATSVRLSAERLVSAGRLPALPTFFEQVTVIGLSHFCEQQVDLAVLEVGLGGRLDATNICAPLVVALTSIGLDHQVYLGDTIEAIAAEKAGIIKPGVPVVTAVQHPLAMSVIEKRCHELGASLTIATLTADVADHTPEGFYELRLQTDVASYKAKLGLRGEHQLGNAAVAIHVCELLASQGRPIGPNEIVAGIEGTVWPGRLEKLTTRGKTLLLDGAHNADGARGLAAFLKKQHGGTPITLIFGAMSDKSLEEMSAALFPMASSIVASGIDNARALEPARILKRARELNIPAQAASGASDALETAVAITPSNGIICAAGSLYLVGELRGIIAND